MGVAEAEEKGPIPDCCTVVPSPMVLIHTFELINYIVEFHYDYFLLLLFFPRFILFVL